MSAFLFRFRGELLALWGIAAFAWAWPPRGCTASLVPLAAGLALRAWARRHIGPHSRGRDMSCPERSVAGPYRFLPHPLYLANLLVAGSLSLSLAGWDLRAILLLGGPLVLYALLARAESAFVERSRSPARTAPHDRTSGGWRSEWASFLPPLGLWALLQLLARFP